MASMNTATAYQTKTCTVTTPGVITMASGGWGWTAGYVALADQAVITAHSNPVTITWDGTAPTATTGLYIGAYSSVTVKGNANVQALQFIRAGGADAVVSITLEKF